MIQLPSVNVQEASAVMRGLSAMLKDGDSTQVKEKTLDTLKNSPNKDQRWGAAMFASNHDELFNEDEYIYDLLRDSDPWIRATTARYAHAWFPIDRIEPLLQDENDEVRRMAVLVYGKEFPLDVVEMLDDPSHDVGMAVVDAFNKNRSFNKWGLIDKRYRDMLRQEGVDVPVDKPEDFKPRYSKKGA